MMLIPYIFPLMLGRTFDINKMKVGVDIFPKETIQNTSVQENPYFHLFHGEMGYNDREDNLDIDRPFQPRIKSGMLNAGVSGEYLSDIMDYSQTIDRVSKSHWTTLTETLDYRLLKPVPNWKDYGEALGTHFVTAIYYGADMISSTRFYYNSYNDRNNLMPLTYEVPKLGSKDQDEKMIEKLKSVESTQFKIFSSQPFSKVPNSMETLEETSSEVSKLVRNQVKKGRGIPVMVRLEPLKMLDSSIDVHYDERFTDYIRYFFLYEFDDLRKTKRLISRWVNSIEKPLTGEQEQKVVTLYNCMHNLFKLFLEAIERMGTPKGLEQLKKAEDAYSNGTNILTEFYNLKNEIEYENRLNGHS